MCLCTVVDLFFLCSKGTRKIEIINLEAPMFEVVEWDGRAFETMKNLKTLIIRNGNFFEGPKHLPNSLRVLEWSEYPSHSLPADFHPRKLAILKLSDNCFTSLPLVKLLKASIISFYLFSMLMNSF